MYRKIYASREAGFQAEHSSSGIVKVYSFFPVDKANCECAELVAQWQKRLGEATAKEQQQLLAKQQSITCPRSKVGLNRYEILCRMCGQRQGYCWASDATLHDWCDFHYIQWTPGDYWRGCFTPHISPVSQQLCLECCCGNDTRDFRANATLAKHVAERLELQNSTGRRFGNRQSKFAVQIAR